jgi:hypothetical protein
MPIVRIVDCLTSALFVDKYAHWRQKSLKRVGDSSVYRTCAGCSCAREWLQNPTADRRRPTVYQFGFLIVLITLRASSSQATAINSSVSLSWGLVIWAVSSRHRLAKSSYALRMIQAGCAHGAQSCNRRGNPDQGQQEDRIQGGQGFKNGGLMLQDTPYCPVNESWRGGGSLLITGIRLS